MSQQLPNQPCDDALCGAASTAMEHTDLPDHEAFNLLRAIRFAWQCWRVAEPAIRYWWPKIRKALAGKGYKGSRHDDA